MTIRVGINGFGRIGRVIFRLAQKRKDIKIVGINDLLDTKYIAYLLKYDSTHGNFLENIEVQGNSILLNGNKIRCTSEKNPKDISWGEIGVDCVAEATGLFLTDELSRPHISCGAKKVVLTGPSKDDTPMFVMGVNHHTYQNQDIVSNASCTTNCLSPIAKIVHENFGIQSGIMTTVHAATATQKTVDGPSVKNWRDGRGSIQNIIPSTTGAAQATGKIIPDLQGKLTGMAFRVPIANVSVVDFTVSLKVSTSFDKICELIKEASRSYLRGIVGYTDEEVVSSDFNGNTLVSIFDAKASSLINGNFAKLISWYDNETGYSEKVLDLIKYISR
ncbi:type I glyceraldehyde-3-phosphate dehydrogenase [Candidatus Riesia pediculischaeffi]|uniref:Glyceraldehyde-3-phosphate dehydrogenase n=1 Tax=Candidatus Riesia pediculischaeffi PTSU TaxID=1401651 RepID=A0A0C1S9K2_9ENTR|nr:type I glyceraldehyde-3-phosphate dehydrogenase [Candidatus Riesia pediculischaeffi]KIE63956.1 NAD-dependent glyceraldehyde-3-phosphate dehydrogenase [Candidatus Riesia pediculischaeffi PTSU]